MSGWLPDLSGISGWQLAIIIAGLVLLIGCVGVLLWKRWRAKRESIGGAEAVLDLHGTRTDSGAATNSQSQLLAPHIEDAILSTYAIAKDLQQKGQNQQGLKAKEEENRNLKKENSNLKTELGEISADLDKARLDLKNVSQELIRVTGERDKLRARCVFLKDDSAPLAELVRNLGSVEEACEGMYGILNGFAEQAREIDMWFIGEISSFMLPWLHERRRELNHFLTERVSSVPFLVGPHAGREVTAGDFAEEMEARFFDEFVRPRYGTFLAQLQRFYGLPRWADLAPSLLQPHSNATVQLRRMEEKAGSALKFMGIEPLALNFFEPYPEDLNSYVQVRPGQRNEYYSQWHGESLPPSSVLEVERWAYLDRKNSLRNGEKASIVVVGASR